MCAAPRRDKPVDARGVAAEVLVRVESDGAFAAAALDTALHRATKLEARDRALATELVYGTLRCLGALDEALGRHARDGARSLARLDPRARAVLRVAAYQILALERVPPRAAVDAAVQSVKGSLNVRLAGFVNALLRALSAERPDPMPADARSVLARRAVPPEVVTRLNALLGDETEACLAAMLSAERTVQLRVQPHRVTREALAARLAEELPGAEIEPGRHAPWCLRVRGGGDVTRTAAWREGLFGLQEEAAQALVAGLPLAPGMRVLDVCAGRGGKSAAIATRLAGEGTLHAVDLFPEKLARLRQELARLGLDQGLALDTFAVDLTRGDGDMAARAPAGGYDLVLVDAPCSGLGTLGHRPDVLLRLRDPAAWQALTATQSALLARAATRVAPGGALVYAVCTLTRDEGPDVARAFETSHPDFAPEAETQWLPHRDGTDGFLVQRWRRGRAG